MTKSSRCKKEIEEDVKKLEEWLNKQPHLPRNIDKEILTAFVHGTKSLEIAKKKLIDYYMSKSKSPQLFTFPARDPTDLRFKEACDSAKIFFLPKLTKEGYLVLMVCFDMDFSKFDHNQYIVRLMMMLDVAMKLWPDMQGIVFATNVVAMDSSIFNKMNLAVCTFFIQWFQSTMPFKLKRAIAINAPKFFEMVINNFFKPFLSKKLFDRLVFTSENEKSMKNYIEQDILPCDYGGKEKSSTELNNYWLDVLVKERNWFLETCKHVVDESKRPPDSSRTYGIDGTFRSLSID